MKQLFSPCFLLQSAVLLSTITISYVSAGEWKKADLTTYESYPTTSEECHKYSGCDHEGEFAFVYGKKSEDWVKSYKIISIHSKFSDEYKLKRFRVKQGNHEIEAKVLDECNDEDCPEDNCCTTNMKKTGFLIDMEKYTFKKFKGKEGVVQWKCLDCDDD